MSRYWNALIFGIGITISVWIQMNKLIKLYKYGIKLPLIETKVRMNQFIQKISCLTALAALEVIAILQESEFTSFTSLLISTVMLPLAMTLTLFEYKFKLSQDENLSIITKNIVPMTFFIGALLKIYTNLDNGSDLIYFMLRIFLISFLAFAPLNVTPVTIDEGVMDPQQVKSLLSTFATYFPLRKYLLPSTKRVYMFSMFFVFTTICEAFCDFQRRTYSMHIVNSLQFHPTGTNTSTLAPSLMEKLASVRIEFRWDYVLYYYIFRFLDAGILWGIRYYIQQQIAAESMTKLQIAIFSKLQNLSLRWHLENQSSEIFVLLSSSPQIIQDIFSSFSRLIPDTLNMIVTIVYMIRSYSFKLTSVVIICGIISTLIDVFVIKRQKKFLTEKKESESKVRTTRSATFENYETMKCFSNENYEQTKYETACHEDQKQKLDGIMFRQVFRTLRDFCRVGAELIVILLVIEGIIGGASEGLTAGDYLYFSGVFITMLWPVDEALAFFKRLQEKSLDVEKISAVLALQPEIVDDPDATDLEINETGGSIEFQNVSFSYVTEHEVIKNFNFFIPAGHSVAFVGRSGSGKSTLAKLLLRFYDATGGDIFVNGQNIRKVTSGSLRKAISVVQQEVVLFADTIRQNIKYGKLEATVEEIETAAKTACIHDRISGFPEKYETEVGNRGLKLSGGEKQRVGIARAILRNAPILILDEATSSLDTETEKQIQNSLEALYKNRTTIVIAHRLSTIVNVNTILVMNEGQIIESGSHGELLEKDGVYASMWHQQFSNGETSISTRGSDSSLEQSR